MKLCEYRVTTDINMPLLRRFCISFALVLCVSNAGCHGPRRIVLTSAEHAHVQTVQWDSPLHASAPLDFAVAVQRYQAIYRRTRFTLDSRRPYQEVDIPLTVRDNLPYVRASWSGRDIDCILDTGASAILWSQWLHLDSQQLGISNIIHWPEMPPTPTEFVLSPRISLGGFTLLNIPTGALAFRKPLPTTSTEGLAPIINLYAFFPVVLTIDYRHRLLVLRNKSYDITHTVQHRGVHLIPYRANADGKIVLTGQLAGHPARFLLDTGCTGFWVSSAFAEKYLTLVRNRVYVVTAEKREPWPVVYNLPAAIAGINFRVPRASVMSQLGNADVSIGASLFLGQRVTVDQSRHLLLIEHNK